MPEIAILGDSSDSLLAEVSVLVVVGATIVIESEPKSPPPDDSSIGAGVDDSEITCEVDWLPATEVTLVEFDEVRDVLLFV